RPGAVRNRFVQIDSNRAPKPATCRAGPERIVESEKTGSRRTNIEIAVRAMPPGGERMLGLCFRIDNVDFAFAEPKRSFKRLDQARTVLLSDRDPVLNDLDARAEPLDLFWIDIYAHD